MLSNLIGKMIAPVLSGQLELTLAKVIKLALGVSALRGPVVGFPFSGTIQIAHLALRQFDDLGRCVRAASVYLCREFAIEPPAAATERKASQCQPRRVIAIAFLSL